MILNDGNVNSRKSPQSSKIRVFLEERGVNIGILEIDGVILKAP